MKKIAIGWNDGGEKWNTVLTVEKGAIVKILPPRRSRTDEPGPVIRPNAAEVAQYSKKYAGDHLANGLAKLGVKPCRGCNKRKAIINAADKKLRSILTRA